MAELIRLQWVSDLGTGLSRRDRTGCWYDAYLPDHLIGRAFRFDGDVAADIAEAEAAVLLLNGSATTLRDTEALAHLLLRAESVASSQIEGLQVGGRGLLRAELAAQAGLESDDSTANEVLGNIKAMSWGVDVLASAPKITLDGVLGVHKRLLAGTRRDRYAGVLRREQNWIGGNDYNPCAAAFIPPPPEEVEPLMLDLCDFCTQDDLPAIAQAAIAHAQFETIHPFVDGNGRTGRALVHVILRRRGVAPHLSPPISLILETWTRAYVDKLMATRYVGDRDSEMAVNGTNDWVAFFAAACRRSVADAESFEARIRGIQDHWSRALGKVRRNSAVDLMVQRLPGAPIVTVTSAAELTGRTFQAANQAIDRLRSVGILAPITVGRRNRAFEARDVIEAFTDLERQLASPEGNTGSSEPVAPFPRVRRGLDREALSRSGPRLS